jgi:hypothetical protein
LNVSPSPHSSGSAVVSADCVCTLFSSKVNDGCCSGIVPLVMPPSSFGVVSGVGNSLSSIGRSVIPVSPSVVVSGGVGSTSPCRGVLPTMPSGVKPYMKNNSM